MTSTVAGTAPLDATASAAGFVGTLLKATFPASATAGTLMRLQYAPTTDDVVTVRCSCVW